MTSSHYNFEIIFVVLNYYLRKYINTVKRVGEIWPTVFSRTSKKFKFQVSDIKRIINCENCKKNLCNYIETKCNRFDLM